jgi:hypothetical protein
MKSGNFRVDFTVRGGKISNIKVTRNGKTVPGQKLVYSPLEGIIKQEILTIGHKRANSPCCVVWGGTKYCWC